MKSQIPLIRTINVSVSDVARRNYETSRSRLATSRLQRVFVPGDGDASSAKALIVSFQIRYIMNLKIILT